MFAFVGVELRLWDGRHTQVDAPTEPAARLQGELTLYLPVNAMEVQTHVRT